jgi:transcriptional pleiotropic regulator of transition state genes
MKATGIVRKVDELGRIVLPIELRRFYGIAEHDPVAIFVDGDCIILKKHQPGCELCGSVDELIEVSGHHFCRHCAMDIEHALVCSANMKPSDHDGEEG